MPIIATPTLIPEVLVIEPKVFGDDRGWFFESFNENDFSATVGEPVTFAQDNHSLSKQGVLRGLHYQLENAQGKLVRVTRGSVYDVAVDLRINSQTFGKWVGVELSATNKKQLWIPKGFAHGFMVISDMAELQYKATDYWHADSEKCINWCDSFLNIQWPDFGVAPVLSQKDSVGLSWEDSPKFNI